MTHHPGEDYARALDAADPLAHFRERFHVPTGVYLCGHSLGLQPRAARELVAQELDAWAAHAVEGHFRGDAPWYSYHELVRDSGARLVGAEPGEVVFMNSLTVNLHLMLATFYRPTRDRYRIVTDGPTFPSDLYALQSHITHRGYDPADALVVVDPLRDDLTECVNDQVAVVLLNGVNFLTGHHPDVSRAVATAHQHGCIAGFDLAHAAGNVALKLHEWGVDFAVWCSYKYLNSGPGAVGGCFVHAKHGANPELPRLAGWWGNDPATRFRMHLEPRFVPQPGAAGWQVSNPPILALAPVRASLALYDEATMPALRAKSERLTGYLEWLLDRLPPGRFEVMTPRDPARRGCMLAIAVRDRPRELVKSLEARGIVCDFREPDVVRVAPVPLYNTFHDAWTFAESLTRG